MEKDNPFRTEQRFVGAYLPPPLADYLRLLSVKENESLQKLVQQMIERRVAQEPEEQVLQQMVEQALAEWERRAGGAPQGVTKTRAYVKEVETGLRRRKVAERLIDSLIKQIQDRI